MAFMKKKTKQRCKTILSLFFALTLIMSAVTFAVSAAEAAALSVQLKTDKEEYTADEDIALTLEIRNGSTGRLVDIAYDITAPDGYELKSGSESGGETELLAGGTLKFDSVYSAVKATPDNPSTDGRINPTVPLISAVICAAALFALNRKKAKKMLASLLCVSLLLTALPLDVAAEEAHLARGKLIHIAGLGREHAEPDDFVGLLRGEQLDLVAFAERPVKPPTA
mgnify:FL=1